MSTTEDKEFFNNLKESLLKIDPVAFVEKYLTLDGEPFRINGNGYKPFVDIYRYVGVKALEKTGKPVILVKSRQIGGTIFGAAMEMYFMGSGLFGTAGKPPIRIIHAFPQLDHAAAYSKTKLNPMIISSVPSDVPDKKGKYKSYMQTRLDTSSESNDSLHFKQFEGGNHIWIESTGLTADRLRGRTADVILYDEVQDIPGVAISNANKMLNSSRYGNPGDGVQVYFGTPKRKGSDYYKMWNASTQQYFYLGCEKCKKHFPLDTPDSDDWEKIWIHTFIVKCTHCNHEQDKRPAAERGKWIATKPFDECMMVGFHINQLFMPQFTKEKILAEKPGTHPINTERAYKNEVLGEFYQGDSSPITSEEIRELCGDVDRKMRPSISIGENVIVTLGIDYGLKADLEQMANINSNNAMRGQSYSTAVILAAKGPQVLSIEFCTKFKKNDDESKKGLIEQLIRQYNVKLVVGDIGFSQDFSEKLHIAHGDRYLVSRAAGSINGYIKYNKDIFPKEIQFQRNHYYSELIDQLKGGNIRFPLGDFEKISWLMDHCANNEIKPSLSRTGDPTINYVKSGPNDGFAALLNAYIGYKFIVTNEFNDTNPFVIQNNQSAKPKPMVIGGYINRKF